MTNLCLKNGRDGIFRIYWEVSFFWKKTLNKFQNLDFQIYRYSNGVTIS